MGASKTSETLGTDGFKYWAFISYSHRDAAWAQRIHRAIESYRIPSRLAQRIGRDGKPGPRRVFPVFRDRDELPSSSDLGATLRESLEQSAHLIVIGSPAAAASKWVNEEVRSFKMLGGQRRVLCLIVDGDPNADDCFPRALRYQVTTDGTITDVPVEPLAADARSGGDGPRAVTLKLIAGLLGVSFDELWQRDRQRQRRRSLVTTGVVLAIVLSFLGFWRWQALQRQALSHRRDIELANQKQQAATREDEMRLQKTEQRRLSTVLNDIEQGREELLSGRPDRALAWLGDAYSHTVSKPGDGPALRYLLARAMQPFAGRLATYSLHAGPVDVAHLNSAGTRVLSIGSDGIARVWDAANGKPLATAVADRYGRPADSDIASTDFSKVVTVVSAGDHVAAACIDVEAGKSTPLQGVDDVSSVAISRDGTRAFVCGTVAGYRNAAVIVDATTGKVIVSLRLDGAPPDRGLFAPDGRAVTLAQEKEKLTASIWNSNGMRRFALDLGNGWLKKLAFSADGSRLVTSINGRPELPPRLWDSSTGKVIATLESNKPLTSLTFNRDGTKLAGISSDDHLLRVWNAADGALLATLGKQAGTDTSGDGLGPAVAALSEEVTAPEIFNPDGTRIVVPSIGTSLTVWDLKTRSPLIATGTSLLNSAYFSPDGENIAAGTTDGSAMVLDSEHGDVLANLEGHAGGTNDAEFGPANRLVTAGADGTCRTWEWRAVRSQPVSRFNVGQVAHAAISNDGAYCVINGEGTDVKLWDLAAGHALPLPGHRADVWAMAFSANNRFAATGGRDGVVHVWDVASGAEKATFDCGEGAMFPPMVTAVIFSADSSKLAAAASDSQRPHIYLWDLQSKMPLAKGDAEVGFDDLRMSPDGRRLISFSDKGPGQIWDWTTKDSPRIVPLLLHSATVKISQDGSGRRLATAGHDGRAAIWDLVTGQSMPLGPKRSFGLTFVRFSPDGGTVALGGEDGSVELWSGEGKQLFPPLRAPARLRDPGTIVAAPVFDADGHPSAVVAGGFSPDGALLAIGGHDAVVRLWDVRGGQLLSAFTGDSTVDDGLALGTDGNRLISISNEQTVQTWDVSRASGNELDITAAALRQGWQITDGQLTHFDGSLTQPTTQMASP